LLLNAFFGGEHSKKTIGRKIRIELKNLSIIKISINRLIAAITCNIKKIAPLKIKQLMLYILDGRQDNPAVC
jgi:hypothetical protein